MSERDTVLVTGASGLVGAEVVARLRRAGRSVAALVHNTSRIVGNDGQVVEGAVPVRGDVSKPAFGMTDVEVDGLGDGIGCLVHCAATTAFDATPQEYDALNVAGTDHAIELARRWDAPLIHVGTAYVCGMRDGIAREDDLQCPPSFGNAYEESKFRAEQRVRAAAEQGLRAAIVRPGIVSGATGTGTIREFKDFYTVVKLMTEGKLRTLPGRYDATVSLAPIDHVADVIAAAATEVDAVVGRTLHAVGADVLSLREVSDVFAEYPSFEVATFVSDAAFCPNDLADLEREYYLRVGSLYTSYFRRRICFDTSNVVALLGRTPPASGKDYLRTALDYCLDVGYLGFSLPGIEDILAADTGSQP